MLGSTQGKYPGRTCGAERSVDQAHAGEHVALVRLEKVAEAGPLDGRAGVQAAALEAVMAFVEPGLRVFLVGKGAVAGIGMEGIVRKGDRSIG